jgi:hypothetical protein
MVRIGGHQSLLYGKDEVVCSVKRRRRHGRIPPPDPELQCVDRLAQAWGSFDLILQAKRLDIFKQDVGVGEQ